MSSQSHAQITAGLTVPKALKRFSGGMPDYSYGIYIYAYQAQQIPIATGIGTTPATDMALGFSIALPFAIASWHSIEKPALALKASTPRLPELQTKGITMRASPPRPEV